VTYSSLFLCFLIKRYSKKSINIWKIEIIKYSKFKDDIKSFELLVKKMKIKLMSMLVIRIFAKTSKGANSL
ncbi:MAG: hypothetical protein ACLUIS_09040, partial [Longibaculum sp.]